MKFSFTLILIVLISGRNYGQSTKEIHTVKVNGIELYYETYGQGEPLFLLHGWTQSSGFWHEYIPAFSKHFKVYAIDLRGHGRTTPLADDFTIKKSSQDILALIDKLKIKKIKAIGLSYGGLTLLQLATLHPDRIAAMVLIGASHDYDGGDTSETDNTFSYENLPAAFVAELKATHHNGERQIKALFNPDLDYKIKLDDKALHVITSKTLIIHGDRDELLGIDPAIDLHKKLPDSELWILPNTGHLAITGPNQDDFIVKSLQFLKDSK